MKRIAVLGGGMVGGFMARELAREASLAVTLYDRDAAALERSRAAVPALAVHVADLGDAESVAAAAAAADLIVGAVPGHMGYRTVQTVLAAGRSIVDISFFPENALELDAFARARGLTAVVDCGVMPGFGGMLGVHLARSMDAPRRLTIMVGGVPVERRWPMEYKAPFSPIDVIEEYTRPARLRRAGTVVVRPALSDIELVDLPHVGTLEAFTTDGLRTLLDTLDLPDMEEKTLRWPGHAEKMRMLRELGFFSTEPLDAGGSRVRPLDLTARLLFDAWRLTPGMPELTVMRVEVEGQDGGAPVLRRADLLDRTDTATGDSSMARTTGWPAILVAKFMAAGTSFAPGVIAAETLAYDTSVFTKLVDGLRAAGIGLEIG